jgi:hypothetical protein
VVYIHQELNGGSFLFIFLLSLPRVKFPNVASRLQNLPQSFFGALFYRKIMISGLSKAITLYLAPLLGLATILLTLFAFLAPTFLLHDKVALVVVVPSTALIQGNSNSSQGLDGPSIFMGILGMRSYIVRDQSLNNHHRFVLLGSCSKLSNSANLSCTAPTVSPQYGMFNHPCKTFGSSRLNLWIPDTDFSVLPGDAPSVLLTAPNASSAIFIAVAISFSILFLFSFTLISFRHKMNPKLAGILDKPIVQRLSAWVGMFGFMIGMY